MNTLKYILGVGGMIGGFFLVWKSEWFFRNFGMVPFAEKYLGSGNSRFFYKLLGVVVIFICLIWITGTLDDIFLFVLGPLFGGLKK